MASVTEGPRQPRVYPQWLKDSCVKEYLLGSTAKEAGEKIAKRYNLQRPIPAPNVRVWVREAHEMAIAKQLPEKGYKHEH